MKYHDKLIDEMSIEELRGALKEMIYIVDKERREHVLELRKLRRDLPR